MYLLYLDESGSPNHKHFVVGGLLVHEQDVRRIATAVDDFESAIPNEMRPIEFHASEMRTGRGRWRNISEAVRVDLIDHVADLLIRGPHSAVRPPVLFATAFHRRSFPHADPIERSYEEFFARANGFLGRIANAGDRHRCIAISDNTSVDKRLQPLMRAWQRGGATTAANIGRLESYAEVPLFVDSKQSRLIQLADFVAHWVFRAYESGDTTMLDRLLENFDASDGRRHGLVHLVRGFGDCGCAACVSRR